MSTRTVADLKESVSAQLSGLDINQVDNVYPCFERAARVFMQRAKMPETQVKQTIVIYDGVTDYLADERMYAQGLIDIRPQGLIRERNDFVYLRNGDDFDRNKSWKDKGTKACFDYDNGTPIIRIQSSYTPVRLVIDPMNDSTTWTSGDSVSSLATDYTFYYQQPASIRFNLLAAGTDGYLEKTINPIDLTPFQGVGVVFLAIEIPALDFSSFELRIGSDSANYYKVTNTTGTLGPVINQFMLVAFDLSLATIVGAPNIKSMSYLRVTLNYNGNAEANVRVGNLFMSLPTPVTVVYSAAALFLAVGQTAISNSITLDTDVIVLNDAAYTIFEMECAKAVLKQAGGAGADSGIAEINADLNSTYTRTGKLMIEGLYDQYKAENPSQTLRTTGSYYDTGNDYNGNL